MTDDYSSFLASKADYGADAEHSRYGLLLVAQTVARQLAGDGQRVRVAREVER